MFNISRGGRCWFHGASIREALGNFIYFNESSIRLHAASDFRETVQADHESNFPVIGFIFI
jgi:hypothetical protein